MSDAERIHALTWAYHRRMDLRCVNCGAVLPGPAPAGVPFHCSYCGAPQPTGAAPPQNPYAQGSSPYGAPQNPYGPGPSPYGAAPPRVLQLQGPGVGGTPANVSGVFIAIAMVCVFVGGISAFIAARSHAAAGGALGLGGGYATKSLATLSLAQTPEAMAKLMGGAASALGSDRTSLMVNLSGGPYQRINFTWDKADTSHVQMVYLYADSARPDAAAVHAKLATLLGPRLDAKGSLNWRGLNFDVDTDTAHVASDLTYVTDKNPYWKPQIDAGWDVLRSVVLGLPVTVTQADTRDWLARGYTLQALGAIDPTVDVDHAAAMMQAAFPAVGIQQMIGLSHTLALDNPWFSEAELTWPNKKGAVLEEMNLRPPPYPVKTFPDQSALEACVQNLVGGKAERRETDHLKGTHSTEWNPADGGSVSVDENIVWIRLVSVFVKKSMPRAEFSRILTGLGNCAPKR